MSGDPAHLRATERSQVRDPRAVCAQRSERQRPPRPCSSRAPRASAWWSVGRRYRVGRADLPHAVGRWHPDRRVSRSDLAAGRSGSKFGSSRRSVRTLDATLGFNRGLLFTPEMLASCGREVVVHEAGGEDHLGTRRGECCT